MSKADHISMLGDYLRGEGYVPQIDEDGDLKFKYEGRSFWILLSEKDETFFQLVFPNFWEIESPEERIRVERAALLASADTKVAKVYPVKENVWASIEMFVSPMDAVRPVFNRSLRALQAAVEAFKVEMNK